MPVVACPKCKTKFKLSTEQLGKAVRCNSCQTKFRTAAPASAGKTKSAQTKSGSGKAKSGKAKSVQAKSGKAAPKAPPAKKRPLTLEDELFASALKPGAPDPLGNFVLEDPGFGSLELPDPEGDDSDGDLFADRQHLMNNPAIEGRNPYAASTTGRSIGKSGAKSSGSRTMRERLLRHEEAVKGLGFLQMFGGGFALLFIVPTFIVLTFSQGETPEQSAQLRYAWRIMLPLLVFLLATFLTGWYVYKLRSSAKIIATILLIPNLLNVPLGTAISGYFLWILHCDKGKEVFSDEYKKAIAATPDIRTGRRLMIVIGVAVVLLVLAIAALMFFVIFNAQN